MKTTILRSEADLQRPALPDNRLINDDFLIPQGLCMPEQQMLGGADQTTPNTAKNHLFPIFLKLDLFVVVVVGAGVTALEKIRVILNNSPGATVYVIAEIIHPEIHRLNQQHTGLIVVQKTYHRSDITNANIVIAATDNRELNNKIYEDAKVLAILINVVDTPELCDFYLSSIVQKGDLKIAISTNGKSPTLAKRLKTILHDAIPADIQQSLDNLFQIRSQLHTSIPQKIFILNSITSSLVEDPKALSSLMTGYHDKKHYFTIPWNLRTVVFAVLVVVTLMVSGHLLFRLTPIEAVNEYVSGLALQIDVQVLLYIGIGFLAQMIDGAFGMAYGPTTTSFLMAIGISPAVASATLHTSEIFTAGAASLVYKRNRHIHKDLFVNLVIPGMMGAIAGATTLSFFSKEYVTVVKPYVAAYTLVIGVLIILRTRMNTKTKPSDSIWLISVVGFGGAFFDSIGGGGWGAIVTSSLLVMGRDLRFSIGSAHAAKFFVALTSSLTFFYCIGIHHLFIVTGIVLGGMLAAPLSITLGNTIPVKRGLFIVGCIVILLSLRTIFTFFGVPIF